MKKTIKKASSQNRSNSQKVARTTKNSSAFILTQESGTLKRLFSTKQPDERFIRAYWKQQAQVNEYINYAGLLSQLNEMNRRTYLPMRGKGEGENVVPLGITSLEVARVHKRVSKQIKFKTPYIDSSKVAEPSPDIDYTGSGSPDRNNGGFEMKMKITNNGIGATSQAVAAYFHPAKGKYAVITADFFKRLNLPNFHITTGAMTFSSLGMISARIRVESLSPVAPEYYESEIICWEQKLGNTLILPTISPGEHSYTSIVVPYKPGDKFRIWFELVLFGMLAGGDQVTITAKLESITAYYTLYS